MPANLVRRVRRFTASVTNPVSVRNAHLLAAPAATYSYAGALVVMGGVAAGSVPWVLGSGAVPIAIAVVLGWLFVAGMEMRWRLANGLSVSDQRQDAFAEVLSIRWYLIALGVMAACASAGCLMLFLFGMWELFGAGRWSAFLEPALILSVLGPLSGGAATGWIAFYTWIWIENAGENRERYRIAVHEIPGEIADDEFADLGATEFPANVMNAVTRAVLIRLALLAAILLVVILATSSLTETLGISEWTSGLSSAALDAYLAAGLRSNVVLQTIQLLIAYSATCLLILSTITNRGYLYFSARTMTMVTALLVLLSLGWITVAHAFDGIAPLLLIVLLLPAIRLVMDLVKLALAKRRQSRVDPIAEGLVTELANDMAALARDNIGNYRAIEPVELGERLDHGARTISREALLAPPQLGRYMRDVEVRWRRCATAIARFMTVDRTVALVNARSTYEPLRNPGMAPAWNETLFPLRVPAGYHTINDPLLLGPEWCMVKLCWRCSGSGEVICSGCSGSGRVTRTETRYEQRYQDGKSVSVAVQVQRTETCGGCGGSGRVTCGTCFGSGRLKYDQLLTTIWKSDSVYGPYPQMTHHELIRGAEEFEFATLRMAENRCPIEEAPTIASEGAIPIGLAGRMMNLRARFASWSKTMCAMHGGILYRSELGLAGFTTLRCAYGAEARRHGFFFGAKPAFHFPRMPFDFYVAGAIVMVPAAVLLTAIWEFRALALCWDAIATAGEPAPLLF